MPIFDYQCERGHKSEQLVRRADATPPCPECGGPTVKLLSAFYPRHTERVWRIKDPRVVIKNKDTP